MMIMTSNHKYKRVAIKKKRCEDFFKKKKASLHEGRKKDEK
jgi:hypothetical protein